MGQEELGGPHLQMEEVGRPSRRSWRALEVHLEGEKVNPEVRIGLAVPPRGPGGVGRTIWRCGSGWVAHSKCQERSECPPADLLGVGRSIRRAGRGQEAHPEAWQESGGLC